MTAAKIAITLPKAQLARVKSAVKHGQAKSVSAYIVQALEKQAQEESLAGLVQELIAEYGEPSREDKKWAENVLGRRRKGKG